ncbi:ATP-binding protein [Vulgatibacter incomptus]|uniref:ATP-binding protein n=1 Tax=Vulgatibacter incomptus TaxID=1391653 RepID=UPI0014704BC8|nr:tetratricopeptide repeat protein [Vulgatibacter incomptus]
MALSTGNAHSNLLPDRTPFIGRRREVSSLEGLLIGGARLVTVVGPSGMGKTRLARQLALRLESRFRTDGGTWLCDLSAGRSARDLETVLASVLGTHPRQLADALENRGPTFVVLDNLEAIAADAAGVLGTWLDRCRGLQILATSLVPIGMEGETRFELHPLEPDDAAALYRDRAGRAAADRAFTEAEHGAIAELVERLDRLPLALELAAARIRTLPPGRMLARISERFDLLRSDAGRRSLQDAISLTWELLAPEEADTLAQSAVFAGGFSLEAAEQILRPGERAILDVLESLRAKALLQLSGGDAPRFFLYESVREFALRKLKESGRYDDTIRRQADCLLAAAEVWASEVDGPGAPAAFRSLAAERENLLAIHRRFQGETPAVAARAGLALAPLAALQGPPASEAELLDSTLDAATRSGDPRLVARALRVRAAADRRFGEPDAARSRLYEAVALATSLGDAALEGFLRCEACAVLSRLSDVDGAEREVQRALRLADTLSDPLLEGLAHLAAGVLEESRGGLAPAADHFDAALARFRKAGHVRNQGLSLLNLGAVRSGQGRYREAREVLDEALAVFRRIEDRASEADAILNLGSVDLTAGHLDEAEHHLLQALALERQLGNRRFEALALANLGLVCLERGQIRLARERLDAAISLVRAAAEKRHLGLFLPFAAAASLLAGRRDEAARDFADARRIFTELLDPTGLEMVEALEHLDEVGPADDPGAGRAAASSEAMVVALRILERTRQRRLQAPGVQPDRTDVDAAGIVVGPQADWIRLDGGQPIDLRKRAAARRILFALVEQRLLAPGVGITQDRLVEIGWPGEQIRPDAAANRVYTAIWFLRSVGLAGAIRHHAEGYLLDPAISVVRR